MKSLLCVWEQGGNLGHLANLLLPIRIALHEGFEVTLTARELHRAKEVLGDLPVRYLQAPFKQNVVPADQSQYLSFTHLLRRQCFSDTSELEIYLRAWRGLFDLVRPDVVMYEHSPTALIASRGCTFKRILVGTGFTAPLLRQEWLDPFLPFPTTASDEATMAQLRADDAQLKILINTALRAVGAPPVNSLAEIYSEVHAQFLMTWPQLDHFGQRAGHTYLGIEPLPGRVTPQWGIGGGNKVFGYLQPIASLEALLKALLNAGVNALLLVRDLPAAMRQKYTGHTLRFTDELVDLTAVAQQASWVITHGNLSTVTTFMLGAVPQLLIPRYQEQLFVTRQLTQHGSAIMAYQDQPSYAREIGELQNNPVYRNKAIELAKKCPPYAQFHAEATVRQALQELVQGS